MATYAPGTFSPQNMDFFRQLAGQAAARPSATAKPHPIGVPAAQEAFLGGQRDAARTQYRGDVAANEYQRATAADQWINRLRDLNTGYDKARTQVPYSYNGRGLLGSGIMHQGLQDMLQLHLRDLGDLRQGQRQQLGGYDLQRQQIEAQRAQALAAIEAQRQALLAQYAPGTIH